MHVIRTVSAVIAVVATLYAHATFAACDASYCNVNAFSGTADQKISAAIAAAMDTSHKTVYFPNGSYVLTKTIQPNFRDLTLNFVGQSASGVKLISGPIVFQSGGQSCLGGIFNFDIGGGFNVFNVKVERMTLDFSRTRTHSIFTSGGCSAGHGIRVGNGWRSGSLTVNELRILYPPSYGIGIQNHAATDIPANNVILTNIYVRQSGSDALDTKRPPAGNRYLTIIDMTVDQIGYFDEQSAAALDISYDDFYVKRVTIVTDAKRSNPLGISENTGIRFRLRENGSASYGTVRDLYVKGTQNAVFFEGKAPNYNVGITVKNFIVKQFKGVGIYLRGYAHELFAGCSFSSVGVASWKFDNGNIPGPNYFQVGASSGPNCPAYEDIGSNYAG